MSVQARIHHRNGRATDRTRRAVASFETYAEAERAVDRLSDAGFPVERTSIVGHDLRYVEQVAGRMTTGGAAVSGMLQGAAFGALLGLIFGLLFESSAGILALLLWGLVFGAVAGALVGALTHAATGGRHDFASVSGVQAERYEVMVDEDVVAEAERILRAAPAA